LLFLARRPDAARVAADAAAAAMSNRAGVILPFPGGVVRSGSKVGSRRIKTMIASTNDAYCPTLRAITETALPEGVNCVLEIVVNGIDPDAVSGAMRAGIGAACREGVVTISAGKYGGKLGPHHFHLRRIMGQPEP
jgi:formylmethanofuran--tetrahydromethanopterin N-formyltransferase